MTVHLIDFDDSFTFNIVSDLYDQGVETQVHHWKNSSSCFKELNNTNDKCVLILGPGPGHPSEYHSVSMSIAPLIGKKNIFILGICLGHQLVWTLKGHNCKKCNTPMHGQQIDFKIPQWFDFFPRELRGKTLKVQRYNSLYIKDFSAKAEYELASVHRELMASRFSNVLTYQFHPESVGTSFRSYFFKPVLDFFV